MARMNTIQTIRHEIAPGCLAMAKRSVDAENNFIGVLMEIAGLSRPEAELVFEAYKRCRLVKRELTIGRYSVTHGAFLERENILRALANLKAS